MRLQESLQFGYREQSFILPMLRFRSQRKCANPSDRSCMATRATWEVSIACKLRADGLHSKFASFTRSFMAWNNQQGVMISSTGHDTRSNAIPSSTGEAISDCTHLVWLAQLFSRTSRSFFKRTAWSRRASNISNFVRFLIRNSVSW